MSLTPKAIRSQLNILMPLMSSCSLKTIRKAQNKVGELMEAKYRRQVKVKEHPFAQFSGCWILPRDQRRQGVILYLHGGGFVCGDLDYAKGFGSMLATRCGVRVFCAAYRLAPEHPFPAGVEDALESYRYLLEKGYDPARITLCGESAGGGLCYSLCMKLKQQGLPLPAGIIAISPWVDLTASGASYEVNKNIDPSMRKEILDYFTECYTENPADPLVSPLLGDLTGMPPSAIFVGGDEILLSDAEELHKKLLAQACRSQLTVAPHRWHGYILYGLTEDEKDTAAIDRFLSQVTGPEQKQRWMRLDNAAKIYPAARRNNWSNVFRISATLSEDVDRDVLQSALDVTVRRFPSIATRLRRGVFWYYLEQLEQAPAIREEHSFPLARMSRSETRKCAFRVIVWKKRIALELFHSLTDGNGALIFLKTLLAEYLQQKYDLRIPAEKGVLGRLEEPSEAELEDSFPKYAGTIQASRKENDSYHPRGTPETDEFLHITCFTLPAADVVAKAHEYGITVTAFLCAVTMHALQSLQAWEVPDPRARESIRILLPVNLRPLFPSNSLRNFALYTIPEIQPRLGHYSFPEICKAVHHHMGMDVTAKQMSMKIATNVSNEKITLVKLMPLFVKNIIMKAVFQAVGERKSALSLSNLGAVQLPDVMKPYIQRMDFILGTQATSPYNCGVLSYDGTLYINFIRDIREPVLEERFCRVLQELGLNPTVQTNRPQR